MSQYLPISSSAPQQSIYNMPVCEHIEVLPDTHLLQKITKVVLFILYSLSVIIPIVDLFIHLGNKGNQGTCRVTITCKDASNINNSLPTTLQVPAGKRISKTHLDMQVEKYVPNIDSTRLRYFDEKGQEVFNHMTGKRPKWHHGQEINLMLEAKRLPNERLQRFPKKITLEMIRNLGSDDFGNATYILAMPGFPYCNLKFNKNKAIKFLETGNSKDFHVKIELHTGESSEQKNEFYFALPTKGADNSMVIELKSFKFEKFPSPITGIALLNDYHDVKLHCTDECGDSHKSSFRFRKISKSGYSGLEYNLKFEYPKGEVLPNFFELYDNNGEVEIRPKHGDV